MKNQLSNMFKGRDIITVPGSFQDCLKTDRVTKNLWSWARRIETLGFILFWILAVIGLIVSVFTAVEAADLAHGDEALVFLKTFFYSNYS